MALSTSITVKLSEEDRQRIDVLIELFKTIIVQNAEKEREKVSLNKFMTDIGI